MKRIIACLLTGLLAVGMMAGCSKKLTPEEQACLLYTSQIAALGMAMNGYQCAVMCPTLVLAGQHYDDFTNFLAKFGYTAVFLHGGMKVREEKAALAKIASGEANVVVGTCLLYTS